MNRFGLLFGLLAAGSIGSAQPTFEEQVEQVEGELPEIKEAGVRAVKKNEEQRRAYAERFTLKLRDGECVCENSSGRTGHNRIDLESYDRSRGPLQLECMDLYSAKLDGLDLSLSVFPGALLRGANLGSSNLAGARFDCADLTGAQLKGVDLSQAFLTRVDLDRADLFKARLNGTVFSESDLYRANFNGAVLSGAGLKGALLEAAHARGAKFDNAHLSDADLHGALLSGSDFSEAAMDGADLSGSDLRNARLDTAKLKGAFYDKATKLPFDDAAAARRGMIKVDQVVRKSDSDTYHWRVDGKEKTAKIARMRTRREKEDLDKERWKEAEPAEAEKRLSKGGAPETSNSLAEAEEKLQAAAARGEALGNLGGFKAALAFFYGESEGEYPVDVAELVKSGLIKEVKVLSVAPHQPTDHIQLYGGSVCKVDAKGNGTIDPERIGDTGGWGYVGDRESPCWGIMFIDCIHQDSKGSNWLDY